MTKIYIIITTICTSSLRHRAKDRQSDRREALRIPQNNISPQQLRGTLSHDVLLFTGTGIMKHLRSFCQSALNKVNNSSIATTTKGDDFQEWGQEAAKSGIIIIASDNNRLVGNFPVNLISADFSRLLCACSSSTPPQYSSSSLRSIVSSPHFNCVSSVYMEQPVVVWQSSSRCWSVCLTGTKWVVMSLTGPLQLRSFTNSLFIRFTAVVVVLSGTSCHTLQYYA